MPRIQKNGGTGGGGIGGSTGAVDNALLRADGTGGATLQPSPVVLSDTGLFTGTSGPNAPKVNDPVNPLEIANLETVVAVAAAARSTPIRANKRMAALLTAVDGDPATATAVATTPASSTTAGGYIGVRVNGVSYEVGDGAKAGVSCYFSGDGGVTARAMKSVVAGDLCYWQGSIAAFQLATSDVVDFVFDVST